MNTSITAQETPSFDPIGAAKDNAWSAMKDITETLSRGCPSKGKVIKVVRGKNKGKTGFVIMNRTAYQIVLEVISKELAHIKDDLVHWTTVPDDSSAKKDMTSWRDAMAELVVVAKSHGVVTKDLYNRFPSMTLFRLDQSLQWCSPRLDDEDIKMGKKLSTEDELWLEAEKLPRERGQHYFWIFMQMTQMENDYSAWQKLWQDKAAKEAVDKVLIEEKKGK